MFFIFNCFKIVVICFYGVNFIFFGFIFFECDVVVKKVIEEIGVCFVFFYDYLDIILG